MAEIITTQEERDAKSYLEWDDAALGKMCKWIATVIEKGDKHADEAGRMPIKCTGAALILIDHCCKTNAGTFTLDLCGHTSGDIETGDWKITVKHVRVD